MEMISSFHMKSHSAVELTGKGDFSSLIGHRKFAVPVRIARKGRRTLDQVESRKIRLTSSRAVLCFRLLQLASSCLQYLQRINGLGAPSVPRSDLANLDGGFEYRPDREHPSQFMGSNCCQVHGPNAST